ncbi:MAG: c-type cytochrome [Thermoanaerobaculia bacterium]
MRIQILTLAIPALLAGGLVAQTPKAQATPEIAAPAEKAGTYARESVETDKAYIAALRTRIQGHEKEPAESVFTGIEILKGKPAAAVLAIMEIGYNGSLGVSCSYCHDTHDWASDGKVEKRITRRMSAMVHQINEEILPAIEGLKSEKPIVNCTTCHRGQEKPALNLEPTPAASR